MHVQRRILSWLLLPLMALCSLSVVAEPVDGAAQALHMLGYLGADYPATVANGEVVDAGEYREQLEFLGVLQGLIQALPANDSREQLEAGVASLRKKVEQRDEGAVVSLQARQLAALLASAYEVSQAPSITPDPARGEPLYAQNCSVCHGATGAGDGPAGVGLEPPPANLRNAARLDHLSLYDIYNTIGLGVEGTDMVGFADQLDDRQRWDLASYIASFTADTSLKGDSFGIASLAAQTPAEIESAKGKDAAALFRAQRAAPAIEQRGAAQLIAHTAQTLEKSLKAYRDGDQEQAYDLSVGAYLEGFELVESALDNIDSGQRKTTERSLMAYRQALQDNLSVGQAAQRLEQAKVELDKSAALLDSDHGMSASLTFISSLLILLREGLEAILVLAAILAFLRNTGQEKTVRSVHLGWGLAILAGIGTWALAAYLIDVSGAQRELLEGATALFASVMVLWLGVWMHDRRHAAAWQNYISSSLVSGGGRFGFALLAFFSVYRELFEVILFYETLWLQAGPEGHNMVFAGAGVALVLLLGVAWIILRGSRKLPLATFFTLNAILLCVLSVVFAGHGVAALQEAGVLGTRPVSFFEFDWLGIHPDAYSLGAQAFALIAIVVLYGRSWLAERQRAALGTK
ncbi:cytochrome c/FTR1 family iron permease [Pseudomonas segetis]|uniref:High-affinity iron transporter n=1 Tax=Pseudomonas segetis TaxID=298908 RepID=A0A239G0I3_9PSED|nr:cytochrome c/FTR1 family iron permease [Pseudomonas segetis]SNS62495.1 high-affinity iron transporter [Pseudomonas segetis]